MNRKLLVVLGVIVLIGGIYWLTKPVAQPKLSLLTSPTPTAPVSIKDQKVDFSAGFAIFTNGVFRVFSQAMYHNLSADVFIEAKNPNIIQVKKSGITWGDFFNTLPFKLTKDCLTTGTKETFCTMDKSQLKFYLNGVKRDDLLDLEIKNGDRALVTYGNDSPEQIQNQLQRVPAP